ncbi:MAG TPA: glycosyltransferase family 39 protein [Thermodesulfobacteriota bacterium]|nr:glycosyltransferase family 39 protein [Thermodesulfobacteriota bacterium]
MLGGSEKNYRTAFFILLAVATVVRLFYIQVLELAPDEAYYWTWSRHLQWGYYDHPPMVGALMWIFTSLAGQSEFGVRVGWVVIGILLTIILYSMTKRMFGSARAGFCSALLLNITLLISAGAVIATPDGPQALFWAAAVFSVYLAVTEGKARWWWVTGACLGFGLLSKYTMLLIAPCVLLFLLSSPEGRKWLPRKEPYLAFLFGLAIFSPVILWNAQNDWMSFRFQLSHGLAVKKEIGLRYFGEFWGGQAGLVSPLLFIALLWAMGKSGLNGFRERKAHLLLLFWTSAPVLLFFAATSLRSRVEANWPALAYFSAVSALAGFSAEGWGAWSRRKRGFAWAALLMAGVLTFIGYIQPIRAVVPIRVDKDPTSQLLGWRLLGEKMKGASRSFDPKKGIFLLTPRHQLVGEGMFYTQGAIPVYQWDAPNRVNNLSKENSPPAGSQAIFFTEGGNSLPAGMEEMFASCERLEPVVVTRDSSVVRTHPMWKCTGFKGFQK